MTINGGIFILLCDSANYNYLKFVIFQLTEL